jgi:hypothetical protein
MFARPRVIRGTQAKPLPLLPSGPGGVYSRPLHEAQGLTTYDVSIRQHENLSAKLSYHTMPTLKVPVEEIS